MEIVYSCRRCGGLLDIVYDDGELDSLNLSVWEERPIGVWRYRELLPVDYLKAVTLCEGGTGLLDCRRLADAMGLTVVHVKNEGQNPTGSFKDRGMTVGITKAIELGATVVACASTGNTSASLAAYAARAGIKSVVFVPSGKIALGKLTQAIVHGAEIIRLKGSFDDSLKAVMGFTESHRSIYLLNSINPYRLEGQKTVAFEVYNQLCNQVPDNLILPVGNAGNISAAWKGFLELKRLGLAKNFPRMIGIQAEGASPIASAYRSRQMSIVDSERPETIASAIRIGAPVSWKKALRAIYDSKGLAETVTDTEILEAQKMLARSEGLFIEPASAASIAGLRKLADRGEIRRDETTVCIATGNGLKDPDVIINNYRLSPEVDVKGGDISNILGSTLSTVSMR
jgi:threonine synthase